MTTLSATWARRLPWANEATEAEWSALYAEQLPRVYNYFRYRVGGGPEAEDLTSITFEKAWRARDRYRKDLAAFSTWLFAIAKNVAIDHYRTRHDHRPLDEADTVAARTTPEDDAVRGSDVARLAALLETIGERERELVALKYGAELTNRAIARQTGLSESNVGTILYRTVRELRARWDAPPAAPSQGD
jgi:RNA polymerase sigma-70 factor (ECF subfamily)